MLSFESYTDNELPTMIAGKEVFVEIMGTLIGISLLAFLHRIFHVSDQTNSISDFWCKTWHRIIQIHATHQAIIYLRSVKFFINGRSHPLAVYHVFRT